MLNLYVSPTWTILDWICIFVYSFNTYKNLGIYITAQMKYIYISISKTFLTIILLLLYSSHE